MKIYIGASTTHKVGIFGAIIRWYSRQPYAHVYTRYEDLFTKQQVISESSHGEAHKIILDNWLVKNRVVEEYEIEVSEEVFRAILTNINTRLQASYSELNIVGVPFYDLAEYLKSPRLMALVTKLFSDGKASTICSESAAFTLKLLGIQFNRPSDFVRPDHVIKKLAKLSRTEDYITKVII